MKLNLKILLSVAVLTLWGLSLAAGADVLDRAKSAIGDYALKHNPDWRDCRIVVSIRGGDRFFDNYANDEYSKIVVPSDYRLTKVTSSLFVPIAAMSGEKELSRTMVIARIEVYKDVVVSTAVIPRGKEISADDLDIKTQDISAYQGKCFASADEVAGKITKSLVQKNSVILDWMVKDEPLVSRGSPVKIRAAGENVLVEADGTALEDGMLGDLIPVRRDDSREELKAKVTGPNVVEVKI
ncbi:MAG TPA: flagellar basal body P-ring formation chaperone FlgA [Candidatus Omnitrophota bacterium]|nr:flagellar basal body P-ring formation chaperone FlgA [Candidatus Omnitrophota bacterium]